MKLKYYLRGAGIGIIISTIVLTTAFANKKTAISDDEVKLKAAILGMISVEEADELDAKISNLENEKANLESELEELNKIINESTANVESDGEDKELKDDSSQENSETIEDTKAEEKDENKEKVNTESLSKTSQGVPNGTEVSFSISKGMGSETVAKILESNGLISDAKEFNKYLVNGGYSDMIQVGEYVIPMGATYDEIVDELLNR